MNQNEEATRRATAFIDDVKAIAAKLGYDTPAISPEAYQRAVETAASPVAELMRRNER